MPSNWTVVGDAITARLDQKGMQQSELAARSGVSVATIREIQGGKERRRAPRVLRDISLALGWSADYLTALLHGREPEAEAPETGEAQAPDPSAFLNKLAFVLEHRIGNVVDVIYNNDSDVDITIEIRHIPRQP
ncbi:MAG TPA: helix-turn-helix transcriptional regulator [Trebonia sp.]